MKIKSLFTILVIFFVAGILVYLVVMQIIKAPSPSATNVNVSPPLTNTNVMPLATTTETGQPVTILSEPISNALSRVTKKPFGIKVSPSDSPVSPERFSGYHTGVDFETLAEEQNIEVPIYAVCPGQLVFKKYVSGYGGVAVQSCQINGSDTTVLYGHLKLSSIAAKLNQQLAAGEHIGILGAGYSAETDGERKHLHLGIHKGKTITLLGYVQRPEELDKWIDALTLLK